MELFKNSVGRPSNEIKKKRRIFIISIILVCIIFVGGLSYLIVSKKSSIKKIKGEASYSSVPAPSNIKYMKVNGGLVGWSLSGNKLKVGFYPYGDVNMDGVVSYADARTVLKMSAKLIKKPSEKFKLSLLDMDKNGKINASDAQKILQKSTGLKVSRKVYQICVSTKKGTCNWSSEGTNAEKIYYLKKGTKYYINAKEDNESDVYSSGVITTKTSSKKLPENKWLEITSNDLDFVVTSRTNIIEAYSNDGFAKIEYDTNLLRIRRIDDKKNKKYAKYRVYYKALTNGYIDEPFYTAVSLISKNKARDTIRIKVETQTIPKHNSKYWTEQKVGNLPIYIDKACNNDNKSKEKYNTFIDEIKKLPEYVRNSANYVEILNSKNFESHSSNKEINAGEYFMNDYKIMLNCEVGATKHTVPHEFGHAIDGFYYRHTGKYLHDISSFKKDYNTSLNYKNTILTWNNGYAYSNESEFFAQAFVSYILINTYNKSHESLRNTGQTILIKNVVDLNYRIKNNIMPEYNKLYKTIYVD